MFVRGNGNADYGVYLAKIVMLYAMSSLYLRVAIIHENTENELDKLKHKNMNEKFTLTGGARIGSANASYPFADLYVDKEILKINASIVGNLVFQPKDIISIKPYTSIPIIGNGIKITHRIENYNSEVIFWTFKNPSAVVNEIQKTGFLNNTNSEISPEDLEILKKQSQGGFPIKKSVAIFFIVAWNLLFLSDIIPFMMNDKSQGSPIGIGMNLAVGLLFISSISALISEKFRKLILKEGRELDDIKKSIYLVMFVSGIMFIAFTIGNINK
jgi:predicted secreted protein